MATEKCLRLSSERRKLAEDNKAFAAFVTWKYANFLARYSGGYPVGVRAKHYFNELIDAAWIGLCIAALSYDSTRGTTFCTYAHWQIRSKLQRALRDCEIRFGIRSAFKKQTRIASFSEMKGVDPLGEQNCRQHSYPFDIWDDREPEEEIADELHPELQALLFFFLDKRDAEVLSRRVFNEETLQDIAKDLMLSRERVRQLEARALRKLRDSPVFIRALNKQLVRRRQEYSPVDFYNMNIGIRVI